MLRTEKRKKESYAKSNNENMKNQFDLLFACRQNAADLLTEADLLLKHKHYARAYFLAYSANEEISKGQIVADYISRVASKEEFTKAFYNHDIKVGYSTVKVQITKPVFTGDKFEHNGQLLDVFVQDNTLTYDMSQAKDLMNQRNSSMYVSYKDDYVPVTPKGIFKAKFVREFIKTVKKRLSFIFYAEDLNGRVGTKALIK